jgi:L-asparaginase type II
MSLPQIALIGTGGTIAGAAAHATSTTRYQPASLGIETVVQSVPELQARYRLQMFQPMQLGSYDVTPAHWRELHAVVTQALADPETQGAVITHGTDTLEETATFLSLSIASDKPVVVIGAMRPATAHSADGPANVLDACTVAADPHAGGRGTLVVMNGRIHAGLRVTKRHVSSVEAFESPLAGALGEVADQSVRWFGPAHRCPPVTGPLPAVLPRVDVAVSYAGADDVALKAFVAAGARGIVHAGLGNANAPAGNRDYLRQLPAQGIVLARCSRWIPGTVTRNSSMFNDDALGSLTAGTLPAHKTRIALMLGLSQGMNAQALQAWLDRINEH